MNFRDDQWAPCGRPWPGYIVDALLLEGFVLKSDSNITPAMVAAVAKVVSGGRGRARLLLKDYKDWLEVPF